MTARILAAITGNPGWSGLIALVAIDAAVTAYREWQRARERERLARLWAAPTVDREDAQHG